MFFGRMKPTFLWQWSSCDDVQYLQFQMFPQITADDPLGTRVALRCDVARRRDL